ncbi:MAG: hypothetical protein AB198_00540 [Parcubacteria bacterium C7867-003]|nr:MAG: hypothetical protein AB198_00540 [Parcubacteria bacterium C7867-003]
MDVGGIYDSNLNRYDHHQEGGAGKRENGIPYASFGLVWKHYGEQVCGNFDIFEKLDQVLVQPIDAGDNGLELVDLRFAGIHPNTIVNFFESFNPTWKIDDIERIEEFMYTVRLAKDYIKRIIKLYSDLVEAGEIVRSIYEKSSEKRLIVMDTFYPASGAIRDLREVLFTVYPRGDGNWSVKAVKEDDESFVYRKLMPKSWAGKRDAELENITGIKDVIFCHNHLYIATTRSKESAVKMAEMAINSRE